MNLFLFLGDSVLAGFAIGLCGCGALLYPGVIGAAVFCFGLLAVTHYGWPLYTGRCGFVSNRRDFLRLPLIVLGNGAGAALATALTLLPRPELHAAAQAVVAARAAAGWAGVSALAVCCGFIMTAAVRHARDGRYLPLLFGVPLFVLCGFSHSIADIYYYCAAGTASLEIFALWVASVVGNFVGCNLYRIIGDAL